MITINYVTKYRNVNRTEGKKGLVALFGRFVLLCNDKKGILILSMEKLIFLNQDDQVLIIILIKR